MVNRWLALLHTLCGYKCHKKIVFYKLLRCFWILIRWDRGVLFVVHYFRHCILVDVEFFRRSVFRPWVVLDVEYFRHSVFDVQSFDVAVFVQWVNPIEICLAFCNIVSYWSAWLGGLETWRAMWSPNWSSHVGRIVFLVVFLQSAAQGEKPSVASNIV